MQMSDAGIAFLAAHEGIVPAPYLDSVGVWTYGIGHTAAAGAPKPVEMQRGMPADLDAALRNVFTVFRRDLAKYEAAVNAALSGMKVAQHEFDAAVSFHFNTGAIATATWVKQWRAGRKDAAKSSIMSWRKPAAIIPRRQAEQKLWATGHYGADAAPVWTVNSAGKVTWKAVKTLSQDQIIAMLRPDAKPVPAEKPAASTTNLLAALFALLARIFGESK